MIVIYVYAVPDASGGDYNYAIGFRSIATKLTDLQKFCSKKKIPTQKYPFLKPISDGPYFVKGVDSLQDSEKMLLRLIGS